MISRILFVLLAILGLALAIILFFPGLIPISSFKSDIEEQASKALGRPVTIGDELSIRIFPQTAFKVSDLTIANADSFEGDTLARVKRADVGVKLFPLFSNTVVVERFVLTEPAITLIRKADGAVNWNLAAANEAPTNEGASDNGAGGGNQLRELSLGDVRIVDGRATYRDDAAARTFALEDINVSVLLTSLSAPLEVNGDLLFQGEETRIDMILTDLATLMAGEPANLKFDAAIGETTAGADIALTSGDALSYAGPISFNAPDLPAFAAIAGVELVDAPGFDRLSLNGDVEGNANAMRLSAAEIGFDQIEALGAMSLDWSGAKPRADGILSTPLLDLKPYMPPPAPDAEGFPAWSEAPMDFTALRNIDAEFDISADQILLNDLKIGESRLKLNINDGRMTADIPELAMYGGQGSGRLVVNARGARPSFAGNFDMEAVEAQPMSLDVLRHDNLLGLGAFKLDFTAAGDNQAAIMSSIDGSGGFDLSDGAIKGVNLVKLAQAANELRRGGINPAALTSAAATARGPREATDFSTFLSNFTINDGLIEAPTIAMDGPYLTMTGAGTVDLAGQQIDLRLAPRASDRTDGQPGSAIAVPIRIGGTFSEPTVAIDAEALASAAVQGALGGFLNGGAATPEDALREGLSGLLNAGGTPPADGATDGEPSTEEALIREGLGALLGSRNRDKDEKKKEEEKK